MNITQRKEEQAMNPKVLSLELLWENEMPVVQATIENIGRFSPGHPQEHSVITLRFVRSDLVRSHAEQMIELADGKHW